MISGRTDPENPQVMNPSKTPSIVCLGLTVALVGMIVHQAWLCDDAYITFRTVDNFVNGYGLRWNVAERVQVFTHPLWMFLVSGSYALTGEMYFTAVLLSIGVSAAAVVILAYRVARTPWSASAALGLLLLSVAFVDFSTSGLENPLTHLLLATFFWIWTRRAQDGDRRTLLLLAAVAGLAALNRLDSLLFYIPPLAAAWWRTDRRRGIGTVLLGFAPLAVWELFCVFYYGFPLPSSAYSKLDTGISIGASVAQGLRYLRNSLEVDPVTLLATAGGIVVALTGASRRLWPFAASIALYLVYVLYVGGDFMSGRFLTGGVFVAALLVSRIELESHTRRWMIPGLAVVLLLGVIWAGVRFGAENERRPIDAAGVADERRIYSNLQLWNVVANNSIGKHRWVKRGRQIRERGERGERVLEVAGGMGLLGFYAGPLAHIVDVCGLSDPLIVRLPVEEGSRIGHFVRPLPRDYLRSLKAGRNLVRSPELAAYADKLFVITRGDLLSWERLRKIVRFNLGHYDSLIEKYVANPSR